MDAAEVPFRGWRLAQESLERVLALRGAPMPRPRGAAGAPWVGAARVRDPAAHVALADRILGGEVPAFETAWLRIGTPPDWLRDPRTGLRAPPVFGRAVDYRDPTIVGDAKYVWEPNRHLHLVALAQAYRLTGERRYLDGIGLHLDTWLAQCRYPLGINWSSALEAGIRLLNWSATWHLIGGTDSPLFAGTDGERRRDHLLASVYLHAGFIRRHVSRYSSANNHTLGEMAGLYVGATTWPLWTAMARWKASARRILIAEAMRQTAPDGVDRERAIGYHCYALEYMLIAALAGRAAAEPFPESFWQRLYGMVDFLAAISDPDGRPPMFGDSDGGTALRLGPDRALPPAARYAAWVGLPAPEPATEEAGWLVRATSAAAGPRIPPSAFPNGGYYVLRDDGAACGTLQVVADAGPLGLPPLAAHGHAGALAFTMSIDGIPFLTDPGTYDYYSESRWRDYFRSTAAHNTVRVDEQDQSAPAGRFLWKSQARTRVLRWSADPAVDELEAEHDGYRRLADPVTHRRRISLDKAARCVRVTDRITCAAPHVVEWFWHIAETWRITRDETGITASRGASVVRVQTPDGLASDVTVGDEVRPAGWRSPAFGLRIPCATVVWRGEIAGPATVETLFTIQRAG